jgi:hypothetical protein
MRMYEMRPRKDHRGVDLVSETLTFGRLWCEGPEAVANGIGFAQFYSRSHDAIIRVYDDTGDIIENARAKGRFQRTVIVQSLWPY